MTAAFFRLRVWVRVACLLVTVQLALESSPTAAASIRARGNDESGASASSGGEGSSSESPLCTSSCVADCVSKWYILQSCYDTKWGCFQGCTSGCKGKGSCRSMCQSQLNWLRCTSESCKLGCDIGSSMSTRFPLQVESSDSLGPEPSPESASMAGAEKSGQSSESHDQGAEPSPGDQGSASTSKRSMGRWAAKQRSRSQRSRSPPTTSNSASRSRRSMGRWAAKQRSRSQRSGSAKSSAVDSNAEDDLSSDVPYRRAASI